MVRRVVAALAVTTFLLLLAGAPVPTGPHAMPVAGVPRTASVPPVVAPAAFPGVEPLRGLLEHNLTGPQVTPSAGVPVSAYQETPAPALPDTTPTVLHVSNDAQGCCEYVNETPAGGPWDSVVLNYTGTAVNGVYDSSYRAYVSGAQVLFGTTPEYGTWTVLDNLTEYEALLEPGANFTFILSAATLGGYFETSLTLSFYPAPAGAPVPSEPTEVVPLWSKQFVKPTATTVTANSTVPDNASAVTLELWAYGFQNDEFWWAAASPARSVDISVDGSPFAAVYPFPYVNTGGVDLFLWRPIPAVFTLSDRPYDVNLTGALGALTGRHTYTATIGNRDANSDWLVEGTLLVWTNASVSGASLTGHAATFPNPVVSGSTTSSSTSFRDNSTLATAAGPVDVSTSVTGSFQQTETSVTGPTNGTSWENLSQMSTMTDRTVAAGPNATVYANSTRAFLMSTDLGSRFVVSSTTGGSYPIKGNGTTSMLDVQQQWTELTTSASLGLLGPGPSTSDAVDNEVTGANGIWSAEESISSAGASPTLIAVTFVESATPKYTAETISGPGGSSGYTHLMVGSVFAPTNANGAETILENRLDTTPVPLVAIVTSTPDPVDAGENVTLSAVAHGGAGVYAFTWTDLPSGCTNGSSAVVTCRPGFPGVLMPVVTVRDSLGDQVSSAPAAVVVSPRLNASVFASVPGADVGGALSFSAEVSGGTPPYLCNWTVPGGFPTIESCGGPVPAVTTVSGPVSASVSVTDSTGATETVSSPPVEIHGPLLLYLTADATNGTATVGTPTTFTVAVSGGTAPVALSWYDGTTVLAGSNGTTLTYTPGASGNLSLSVRATDADDENATSNVVTVPVTAATGSTGTPGGSGNSSSPYDATFWVAVALAAIAVFEAVFLIGMRRPPKPRTPPPNRRPSGVRPGPQNAVVDPVPPREPDVWAEQ
jgi:hypothetical protein